MYFGGEGEIDTNQDVIGGQGTADPDYGDYGPPFEWGDWDSMLANAEWHAARQQDNFDPANPGTSAENIGTQGDDPGNGNGNGSEPIVPIDLTPDPRDIDWFHPLAQQEYEAPGVRNFSKFMPRGVQQNRGLFRGPNLSKGKGALYQPWTREGGSRYVPKSIWNYDPVELTDWSGGLL